MPGPEEPDDVVVLGGELAAAMEAERRHEPPGPSPMSHLRYPPEGYELWRWADRPEDAEVAAFVGGYVAADAARQAGIRASLTMDDLYTLLLYARRHALAAIRGGGRAAVVTAFDALSAVDVERLDWRDLVVAARLAAFAAEHTGTPAAEAAAGAIGRAQPPTAEILADSVQPTDDDLASDIGYRLVETPGGPVLFDDGLEEYAPDRDLVAIALSLQAAVEADGVYRPDGPTIAAELPPIWVGGDDDPGVLAAIRGLTGCVSIAGESGVRFRDPFLLGYVAEAATPADAAAIAAAAECRAMHGAVILGAAEGRLCVVLLARSPSVDRPLAETPETMARFRQMVESALRGRR